MAMPEADAQQLIKKIKEKNYPFEPALIGKIVEKAEKKIILDER